TLAAEYPAHTNYLYTTYNASEHDIEFDEHDTMVDTAEDRHKFSSVLDSIGVDQPEWCEVMNLGAAKDFAQKVGYPVLICLSYVLSGTARNVVYKEYSLEYNLSAAASISPLHPVVITKFIDNAQEIDVNAVAHKGKLLIHAVSEHVENAGVHSGDATLVLPPFSLTEMDMACVAWRNTVDFGLPLLNNARCAQLWVEALGKKIAQGGLTKYTKGKIPPEVRSWREFVGWQA
ncbi:glutathione synthetase ATP-binding domain-like protein, partial [Suillus weaverae]